MKEQNLTKWLRVPLYTAYTTVVFLLNGMFDNVYGNIFPQEILMSIDTWEISSYGGEGTPYLFFKGEKAFDQYMQFMNNNWRKILSSPLEAKQELNDKLTNKLSDISVESLIILGGVLLENNDFITFQNMVVDATMRGFFKFHQLLVLSEETIVSIDTHNSNDEFSPNYLFFSENYAHPKIRELLNQLLELA